MLKAVAICTASGLLVGGVGTLLLPRLAPEASPSQLTRETVVRDVQTPDLVSLATGGDIRESGSFSVRLKQYANATAIDDPTALLGRIQSELMKPQSFAVMAEVEILLGRLFQIAPEQAAGIVRSWNLPPSTLSSIFRFWAEVDADLAIRVLGELNEPSNTRILALAIVEVAGVEAIDKIASNAPTLSREGLAMAAFVQRARALPEDALREALRFRDREVKEHAIVEIGRVSASLDAATAVSLADSIENSSLKNSYLEAVYAQWPLTDLVGFLAHVETLDSNSVDSSVFDRAFANSAESDSRRLLEFAQRVGGSLGLAAEASGLKVVAAGSPVNAISYLASVPSGLRHDELATAVAAGYARYDVDAALAWAMNLGSAKVKAKSAVLEVLAAADLARAIQLELEDPNTRVGRIVNAPLLPSWFGNRMIGDLNDPVGIANQIAASDETGGWKDRMLTTALSRWAMDDMDGVIAWIRSHPADVPADALAALAEHISPLDVDRMISIGDHLVRDRRSEWIQRAVLGAVQLDPALALSVTERYRGEPDYERLFATVIRAVTNERGPEAASQLLGALPPESAIVPIAQRWTQLDPQRAADWANTFSDQRLRSAAVSTVLKAWATTDPNAAARRARLVADKALRDETLAAICRSYPTAEGCE